MESQFTGIYILDFFILFFILAMPVPTTPYLIFLFSAKSLLHASSLYLIASNLLCIILFFTGSSIRAIDIKGLIVKYFPNLNLPNFLVKSKSSNLEKKKHFGIKNQLVLRKAGTPMMIAVFSFGLMGGNFFKTLISNTILAIGDIVFYWILIGSGKFIISNLLGLEFFSLSNFLEKYYVFFLIFILILYALFNLNNMKKLIIIIYNLFEKYLFSQSTLKNKLSNG